jgi:cell division protein FtsB
MFDKDIGINWHLRFRLKIEKLNNENEQLKAQNNILKRKLNKYENNNIRATGNWKDNNIVEPSGSIYTARDKA